MPIRQPANNNTVIPKEDNGIFAPSFMKAFFGPHDNVYGYTKMDQ
jgi:hypothetical protein